MRKRCLDMVHQLAKKDDRVVFVGSDLSPGLLQEMGDEYPERYYMEGIAEGALIGMVAGMAMEGYMPYFNTIATFVTRRCYEQVAVDLCLHDLPVRLIGNGGGYVYAPLGPTHEAIEDLSIMRSLPNMAVTAVCDADEMTRLMEATLDWPHPIYIRLAKGGDRIISRDDRGFELGKAIEMTEINVNPDILFISCGVATTNVMEAEEMLRKDGISSQVLHYHTIKPFDSDALVRAAKDAKVIVTVEEHSKIGGLGSAVLECLADEAPTLAKPVKRLAIPDRFADKYGSQAALMKSVGLDPQSIAASSKQALADWT